MAEQDRNVTDEILDFVRENPRSTPAQVSAETGLSQVDAQARLATLRDRGEVKYSTRQGGVRTYVTSDFSDDEQADFDDSPEAEARRQLATQDPALRGDADEDGDEDGDRYDSMTVPQLRDQARNRGVEGASSMNKADLQRALRDGDARSQ